MAVEKKAYTAADYQRIIALPENHGKILELIDGELVEKVPSFIPSRTAVRISRYLDAFADEHALGYITGADGGYKLSEIDTFNPDVAYISKVRLPEFPSREVQGPPDLAVEVKSPTDFKREMRAKAEKYLGYGTRLVWLVFPDEQLVEIYVPNADVQTVDLHGTLDGGDVLPGFSLPVAAIFRA